MEEDTGLELSLGLSCGGSNGKLKGKDGSSSDVKTEDGGNANTLMGDLKNFLATSPTKHDAEDASDKNDTPQSKDNFFTNLAKSGGVGEDSSNVHATSVQQAQYNRYREANNKSPEVEEVKSDFKGDGSNMWLEAGNKRKMLFDDMNRQKKQERETQHGDTHGNKSPMVSSSLRASHISVTTEDGSTAENEDVAESQLDGSTSHLALHQDDGSKHYNIDGRGSSEVSKQQYGQKQSNAPLGNDPRFLNMNYGASLPPMTVQYNFSSKMTGTNGESSTSGVPSSSVMQLMPYVNEGSGSQIINPGNMPLTFGYSPLQLPILNSERSWGLNSHPLQMPSPYGGRNISSGVLNSDRSDNGSNVARGMVQPPPNNTSEPSLGERKAFELTKGGGRQQTIDENAASSSTPAEDEMKGNRAREGIFDGSAIRPGVAPGMKFGGCGSYPDLPWVSTTAPGPNGRTISGVTYKFDKNQIKIVCACHGLHMSPDEFIQHASTDQQTPETNTMLASFPNGNPAASAQS